MLIALSSYPLSDLSTTPELVVGIHLVHIDSSPPRPHLFIFTIPSITGSASPGLYSSLGITIESFGFGSAEPRPMGPSSHHGAAHIQSLTSLRDCGKVYPLLIHALHVVHLNYLWSHNRVLLPAWLSVYPTLPVILGI